MANVEVSRLLAEIAANGDPDIEASRLLAEVAASGDPDAEVSRLFVEVIADYVPDEALLNSTLTNAGNSLSGVLEDSASAGVHELYLCVLNSLDVRPPRTPGSDPPTPPPPPPGGETIPGGGGSVPPGTPWEPVDTPPGYTGLVLVQHEQYLMVLRREMPVSTARPKFFTYLIPD
jgi:hypothetical protein